MCETTLDNGVRVLAEPIPGVRSIAGFDRIVHIEGDLRVEGNGLLDTARGFPDLEDVGGDAFRTWLEAEREVNAERSGSSPAQG